MRIRLKLYATLGDYLPIGTPGNAIEIDVADDATPYAIIDSFKVPRKLSHLVLVNGVYAHPEERDAAILKDGDTLAVWPPVAGG
jgi:molybdopterin converting factor small subunit